MELLSVTINKSKIVSKKINKNLTFQIAKLWTSIIVGWTISEPGKTPHVNAVGLPSDLQFVLTSGYLIDDFIY